MPSGGRQIQHGDLCKDCKNPITPFNEIRKTNRIQSRCRECFNIYSNNQPSRTTEARRNQYVQWKFGLSEQTYKEKLEAQNGVCAICNQTCRTGRELAVDHNHTTNRVRDLLCYRCNTVLGLVEEDLEILSCMMDYLERHRSKAI